MNVKQLKQFRDIKQKNLEDGLYEKTGGITEIYISTLMGLLDSAILFESIKEVDSKELKRFKQYKDLRQKDLEDGLYDDTDGMAEICINTLMSLLDSVVIFESVKEIEAGPIVGDAR